LLGNQSKIIIWMVHFPCLSIVGGVKIG
jgi:hypothetical protein